MNVELMQTLSLIFYLLAAAMFFTAIALFFLLRVPSLFGYITGSTAKKAIESIRLQNEDPGDKARKQHPVNIPRSMITEKISKSGRLGQQAAVSGALSGMEPSAISQQAAYAYDPAYPAGAAETSLLEPSMNETTLLHPDLISVGETTVLTQNDYPNEFLQEADSTGIHADGNFSMDVEISFTESSGMII